MQIVFIIRGEYPVPDASSSRLSNYIKALELEGHSILIKSINSKGRNSFADYFYSFLIPYISFWRVLLLKPHVKVVFGYGFGWLSTFLMLLATRITRKSLVIEVNELPYSIHGISRRDIVQNFFLPLNRIILTRLVYPWINGFIVISSELRNFIENYISSDAVICKIPILVDYNSYQKSFQEPKCNKPYIINTARLNNHKDGILSVFKAIGLAAERGYKLHVYQTSAITSPNILKEIDSIIKQYKLEEMVTFLGDLDDKTLKAYQAHCKMLILNKLDCEQNRYNFATKLGEFLSLGKPIITTPIGDVVNYLNHGVTCLFVEPDNLDQLSASICSILDNSELSEKIGNAGKDLACRHFNYESYSKILSDFFNSLVF